MELEDIFDVPSIHTKNHKTRLAKVELYLEVPTQDGETVLGEDGTLNYIEEALEAKGITFASFGDINLSPIFDDDVEKYKKPVGYLAPDGKFYVIESDEDGLAHLALAPLVYEAYKDTIDHRFMGSSFGLDYDLEKVGFIKVHRYEIRYFAHCAVSTRDGWMESPEPTEEQKMALVRYIKKFNLGREVFVNDHRYTVKELTKILKEGDELAVRKIFEL